MKKNRTLTLLLAWVASFVCCLSYAQHFTVSPAPSGGSFATGTKWYTIKITTENNGTVYTVYLDANVTNSAGHLGVTQSSKPTGDSGAWCVVKDGSNYKFYNKAMGTGYVLGLYAPVTYKRGKWTGFLDRYKLGTWSIPEDAYTKMYSTSSTEADVWTSFALGSPSSNTDGDYFHAVTSKSETYYESVLGDAKTTTPDNIYLNKRDKLSPTRLGAWNDSKALGDDGSRFIFEEYVPTVEVTFNYDSGTGYTTTRTASVLSGKTLTNADVPAVDYYTNFNITTSNKTVSSTNKTFTVSCTPNFPFEEGKVYKMYGANSNGRLNSDASNYCFTARTEDNYITYKGVKAAVDANSYWIFEHVANTENQFYVYNMGTGKYLSSNTQRHYAVMDKKGAGTANQIFRITPNGDGFNLQHQGDTNCCGTHIDGYYDSDKPYLGTAWGAETDPSHDASRVYIMDIAPELAALGNDPATTEGYVGEGPSQVLKTAAAAAGTTPTVANVEACLDAYNNPKLADYVAADKYYQIFFEGSDGTNQALALNAATETYSAGAFTLVPGTVMAVAESGIGQTDNIASIYQFTKGTSGMLVTNVNAQAAWGNVSASGLEGTTGAGTEYPFAVASEQSNNSYWNIATETGHLVLDGTAVRNSTSEAATARLKEVTSIPVTIKPTLWTSLCFPVDVIIPTNLKAYKAGSTEGKTINLDELTAGTRIPAGTGFLALADAVSYTDGAYTFDIATGSEPAANLSGNLFTSTNVKRSGMTDVDYFALATKNAVTGFYKVTSGTVPANKAYLLGKHLSFSSGTQMLQLAIGEGTETGIANVNAENSGKAETYYDLNGRIVAYPTSGVYVTGSGRKVFVK